MMRFTLAPFVAYHQHAARMVVAQLFMQSTKLP